MKKKDMRPKPKARKDKKTAKDRLASIIMNGPITIWSILFIIVPVVILAVMSFMSKGPLVRSASVPSMSKWTLAMDANAPPTVSAVAAVAAVSRGYLMKFGEKPLYCVLIEPPYGWARHPFPESYIIWRKCD